ncbi:MAG: Ig-like domain-containing protein, partial [Desulfuromonadales bacterium]|nr:Ig-like domain-containing protein [Desulfuromonadales bacterium]
MKSNQSDTKADELIQDTERLKSMSGHFRAAVLVVFLLAFMVVGLFSQSAFANPNQAPGTACIGCHNAPMDSSFGGTQEVFVGIDGVETAAVTVVPGGSFEIDWIFEKHRGSSATLGVAPWIGGPAWTYGFTTVNSNPATLGGYAWNTNWDNVPSVNNGTYATWINNGADGDDVNLDVPPVVAAAYISRADGGTWHLSTGSFYDDGSAFTSTAMAQGFCDTLAPDSTYDPALHQCSKLQSLGTEIQALCVPTWGGTLGASGGGPNKRDTCTWAPGDGDGVADLMGADIRVTVPGGTADGTYYIYAAGVGRNNSGTKGMSYKEIVVTVDTTPPTILSTIPANSATGVAVNSPVAINWNEPIDCTTVNAINITFTFGTGALALNSCSGSQAIFDVSGQTASAAQQVTVSTAVKDVAGNSMSSSYSFFYNTGAGDTTPPTISSTFPTNGATGVALDGLVNIVFNENINCATANTTNITSDSPGWSLASCGGTTASFDSVGQLNGTAYNVNV